MLVSETTSPDAKLELNVPTGEGLLITSADIATIKMKNINGGVIDWGFATTNLAAGDFGIYASNSVGGDPITAGTAKLYFKSNGNVGIGTTAPDAKLHVDGAAIIGGNQNKDTTPIAGLHVMDDTYSKWSATLSPEQCALRVETYWNGSDAHPRAAGDYGGGIVFNHLGGHSATHGQNMHCWVGPRVWDTSGTRTICFSFCD